MGEAVADEAELALLGVLQDGVEGLLLGDLLGASVTCRRGWRGTSATSAALNGTQLGATHLHLSVAPAGDLDDHVEDGLLLVGIERDVVPCRDGLAVLLDEDTVLERVRRSDLADRVSHVGGS